MEVKVEVEQAAKIRNLRNFAGGENSNLRNSVVCENSQPCKIYAVVHLSSV